ncbi:aminotransferase class V-fold PLP-dependent enzyme [Caulobacter sp. SLTY]|uniref:cysteine desulfurase family protein n=1 Tax=Caulobacter sp. SLTY TaxID=2683262 RepID=UPI0014122D36|nr:cysteine desulfurase family protein [Caulobacter sp. SLTY]NBB16331.1 aminotransferase class V-fold PLP-dependent enzyme [Caulobacter sp. SLTY]
MSVYLDFNATAPVRPEAREAMLAVLDRVGNPSSVHAAGRAARSDLERAREAVSALVGVVPGSVTFTSGGTEANALAIESAKAARFDRILLGATEHDAVWETAHACGLPVEIWPVDADGVADLAWLAAALARPGRALACLMLANNETGVIQPVAEAGTLVRAAEGWLHVDAVQAAGKIAIDFTALQADTLALSAHKLGGPQGVGALVAGTRATLARRLHGGGQERGRRAGTENLPGIVGFAAAVLAASGHKSPSQDASSWRDAFLTRVKSQGAVILGENADRLPQTACIAFPDWPAETQVMLMDLGGVMISAGAACSSGKVKPSRTVEAMGRPDLAPYSIRLSGGWSTTEADWIRAGDVWLEALSRRRPKIKEVA